MSERVQINAAGQVVLKLKTAWPDGTTHIVMSPLEFRQRLAALVSRPRLHLIRFHRVLAPNAKLRTLVLPHGPAQDTGKSEQTPTEPGCAHGRPACISWAWLLKRVFQIDLAHCPNCGGQLKIVAAILESAVEAVLRSGGEVAAAQHAIGQASTPLKLPSRSAQCGRRAAGINGTGRGMVFHLPWRQGMAKPLFDLDGLDGLDAIPPELGTIPPELPTQAPEPVAYLEWAEIPTALQGELAAIAQAVSKMRRANPPMLRSVIRQLCAGRYLGRHVLAYLLRRNADDLLKRTLNPMVADKQLKPAHVASSDPRQAYVATEHPEHDSTP